MRSRHLATATLLAGFAVPSATITATVAAADCPDGTDLCGRIQPLNQDVSGQTPSGIVALVRQDGNLKIMMQASGLSPGMHLAHIHGFQDQAPQLATCPTAGADKNGDGIVDLLETRADAGITLVPFTDDPAGLTIMAETYPKAGQDGEAAYTRTVEMQALETAMQETYGTPPALETRVVFIHGIPEGRVLPDTVQSLEGVPAGVTLPIACAELRKPEG